MHTPRHTRILSPFSRSPLSALAQPTLGTLTTFSLTKFFPRIYLNPSTRAEICPPPYQQLLNSPISCCRGPPRPLSPPTHNLQDPGAGMVRAVSPSRRPAPAPETPRTWAQCLQGWAPPEDTGGSHQQDPEQPGLREEADAHIYSSHVYRAPTMADAAGKTK